MSDYYKKEVILDLVQSDYIDKFNYCYNKRNEELQKYDALCFSLFSNFLEYYFNKKFK